MAAAAPPRLPITTTSSNHSGSTSSSIKHGHLRYDDWVQDGHTSAQLSMNVEEDEEEGAWAGIFMTGQKS